MEFRGITIFGGVNITPPPPPAPPPSIGDSYGGGYYGGTVNIFGTLYYLVVAPKATGQSNGSWGEGVYSIKSLIRGYETSVGLVSTNGASAAAAYFCRNLTIGGYNDWYLPSRYEQDIIFQNLAPTGGARNTDNGINPYSVPERTANRTSSVPGQTAVTLFQSGNAQAYDTGTYYWTSSEGGTLPADEGGASNGGSSGQALMLDFADGRYLMFHKSSSYTYRAVRKVLAA